MKQYYSPKVVVIGGGTGSFTLLNGLKHYIKDITSIVNMSDDGGSTGLLRDELGVLPPGDARQCLVALSDMPELRQLFTYRFSEGGLEGHSFGNLFISAVEKITNSFEEAIDLAGKVLNIQGRVVPMTTDNATLVLRQPDGHEIRKEHIIGHLHFLGNTRPELYLDPKPTITASASAALIDAELIVIAPGNLYGSIAPALIVDGVRQALKKTHARIVYVCNLVTKPNQTDNFFVHDYAEEIERWIGVNRLDYVVYNTDEPSPFLLERYIRDGEKIVDFDLEVFETKSYRAIGLPLIDKDPVSRNPNDMIATARTLIRHDSDRLARELMHIYFGA
jgi:uncharacterized cofD-like protein